MNMKLQYKQPFWQRALAAPLAGLLAINLPPMPAHAVELDVRRDAAVDAIEKVLPSVVNIATATIVERAGDPSMEVFRRFFGWRVPTERREQPYSIGSGVIIDEEGYVLTNAHVLNRASRAQVKLWNGEIYDAEPVVVYTSQKDVALLKIRAKPGEKFKAIKFAKDDDLLLGETVLALGNPYGLGGSVSRGILSSKNRRPPSGDEPLDVQDWLQTDAAINPGNSGGPLINLRGELIGLNVAVYREEQGMGVGFAIPVKQLSAALSDFFTPELTDSIWFGATVKAGPYPLTVSAVQPGSPAEKAGLRAGQEILEVNGKAVAGVVSFNRQLTANESRPATLTVMEKGVRRTLQVQLVSFENLIRTKLGLTLSSLTPEMAPLFKAGPGEGLFVEAVEKNGPADSVQLQNGFLITAIDGQRTGDLMTVANILSRKKSGDRVQLSVVVRRRVANGYTQLQQGTATVQVR